MNRKFLVALVVVPLLLSACGRPVHAEPPEVPVHPHVDAPEVPTRPHVPVPAAPGDVNSQREINAEIRRLAASHTKEMISEACKIDSYYTALTAAWEDQVSEAAGALGVPHVALRKLVLDLNHDRLSGDDILGTAEELLCDKASSGD